MIVTIVNALTIILGSSIGLVLRGKIHDHYEDVVFTALGLFSLLMGIGMAQSACNSLYMIFSLVLGGILGTWWKLEDRILKAGDLLKAKLPARMGDGTFATGFLDASVLFCVGAMTIVGSFQAGIEKDYQTLLIKSVMDGFSSILLASVLGWGVMFAAITILLTQGSLTLLAARVAPYVGEDVINAVSAVGGVLIMMIGLNLLKIKKIRTANFIPALILILVFVFADPWLSVFRP